jgi:hypothetical protein
MGRRCRGPGREREGVKSWAAHAVGAGRSEGEFLFLSLKIHYIMNLVKFVTK